MTSREKAFEGNEAVLHQCLKEQSAPFPLRWSRSPFSSSFSTTFKFKSSSSGILSYLSHPILERFEDPLVEDAFAVFKANSSLNRVSLCLTLCLCALSMASVVLVDLFLDIWQGGARSSLSDIAVFTVIIIIYARRASRLMWARPFERPPGPRWSAPVIWQAFMDQHYVVLLLLLAIPVEAAWGQPALLSLYLVTSCIFILVASSLLLAHAVAYCGIFYVIYISWLIAEATEMPNIDPTGRPLISYAVSLFIGLYMVYYYARTEEMLLREHFKCQYLAAYLYQSALLEEAITDRLLISSLPTVVMQYKMEKRDVLVAQSSGTAQSASLQHLGPAGLQNIIQHHQVSHFTLPSGNGGGPAGIASSFLSSSSPSGTGRQRGSVSAETSVSSLDTGGSTSRSSIFHGWSRRKSDGVLAPNSSRKRDHWIYPPRKVVQKVLKRYGSKTPPRQHPFRNLPAGRCVQRKFCTVLIAKAVHGSHIRVPAELLFQAFSEFDQSAIHHGVSKVCNTGSTYTASCGLFETWGSARRDALAAVAMASDLVAISEALGLNLCIGLTSGSVIGTLDPVSYSFYDLVGDVVSSATLMAELGRNGQVFLGDSTYQLLDNFSLPRVSTHCMKVRLLNGQEETIRALSNPYASSWWFEHRRQLVLKTVRPSHGNNNVLLSSINGSAGGGGGEVGMTGKPVAVDDDLMERAMEEGSLGAQALEPSQAKEKDEDLSHQGFETLTISDIGWLRENLEGKQDVMAAARRLPSQLATLKDPHDLVPTAATIRPRATGEGGGSHSPTSSPLSSPPRSSADPPQVVVPPSSPSSQHSRLGDRKQCPKQRILPSLPPHVSAFRQLWFQPKLELEIVSLGAAVGAIIWSQHLPIPFYTFIVMCPIQCYLRWTKDSDFVFLCYCLAMMIGVGGIPMEPIVCALGALRILFVSLPALYLPMRHSRIVIVMAWTLLFSNRAAYIIISHQAQATSVRMRFMLERYSWYAVMLGAFIVLKRQTEILGNALPLLVYPRVVQLKNLAHALRARTDEVVSSLIPSHVDLDQLIQRSKLESSPYLSFKTQAVILHVDLRSLSKLDGLISPQQFCAFQKKLLGMLEAAVRVFSACRLWHSDQMYVIACGLGSDLSDSPGTNLPRSNDPVLHALGLSRFIKLKIHEFNIKNRVSLSVRIGIARGPIVLSCVGTERFDATGRPITIAKALALRTRATIIMATADIANHLKEHAPSQMLKTLLYYAFAEPIEVGKEKIDAVELTLEAQLQEQLMTGPRLDDFEVLGLLGSGGYGSVHLARDVHTGGLFALKVMYKRRRGVSDLMRVELNVLAQVQHPHVVRFNYCLQTRSRIVLVMEYIRGGTLKSILKEQKPKPEILRIWIAELVLALGYLHSLNIIHRDIKPDNCMVGENGHLKLTDFGLAKVLKPERGDKSGMDKLALTIASSECSDIVPLMQCLMPQRSSSMPSSGNDLSGSTMSSSQPFRVLVVEDEPFTRLITKAMLKSMGFQPVMAPDGKQALEILRASIRSSPIELVLLDLELPVMSGPEVLAEMQADMDLRYVPVVVLSVDDRTADMAACIELGAKDYFVKPIRMDMSDSLLKFARDRRRELATAFTHPQLLEGEEEDHDDDNDEVDDETKDKDDVALDMLGLEGPPVDKEWEADAAMVDDDMLNATREHFSLVGTPYYMSPEMLDRIKYGKAVDYWSLGILIFEAFAGSPPFRGGNPAAVFAAIRAMKVNWKRLRKETGNDHCLEDLIRGLLNPDQEKRLGAGAEGIEAIKRHPFFAGIDWENVSTMDIGFAPAARAQVTQCQSKKLTVEGGVAAGETRARQHASSRAAQVGEKKKGKRVISELEEDEPTKTKAVSPPPSSSSNAPDNTVIITINSSLVTTATASEATAAAANQLAAAAAADDDVTVRAGHQPHCIDIRQPVAIARSSSLNGPHEEGRQEPPPVHKERKGMEGGRMGGLMGGGKRSKSSNNNHQHQQQQPRDSKRGPAGSSGVGGGALNLFTRTLSFKSSSSRRFSRSRSGTSSSSGGSGLRRSRRAFNRDRWIAMLESSSSNSQKESCLPREAAFEGEAGNGVAATWDTSKSLEEERGGGMFGGASLSGPSFGAGHHPGRLVSEGSNISQGGLPSPGMMGGPRPELSRLDSSRGWGEVERQFLNLEEQV